MTTIVSVMDEVEPRRFQMKRVVDVTGVSGTGIVADGILWPDGTVTVKWRGEHSSEVSWKGLNDALFVHGHAAKTEFVWLDGEVS